MRGDKLPVGVKWCNQRKKYRARLGQRELGRFDRLEDALAARAKATEQLCLLCFRPITAADAVYGTMICVACVHEPIRR